MVYLDNAATAFPKPTRVCDEMCGCMREYCGNPGRGAHPIAMKAANKVYECRERLSAFFGAPGAEYVIMEPNATGALNLAIKGLIPPGGGVCGRDKIHLIISDLEHNSVLRPVERLRREGLVSYSVFRTEAARGGAGAEEILSEISRLICRHTRAVICTAASNVCSVRLPIREIGELCRRRGLIFIVDGAQGAGHFPINMGKMGIDALALPGHKGLYGPQGSGALILGGGYLPTPLLEGGSGSMSFDTTMPDEPPERYEAGTLNVPAAAGLCAGLEFVSSVGYEAIARREQALFEYAAEQLGHINGIKLYAPAACGPVLSFNLADIPPDSVANALGKAGVCVRGGYHCAPLAHRALGSEDSGSVRMSFGYFNTRADIDSLCRVVRAIER